MRLADYLAEELDRGLVFLHKLISETIYKDCLQRKDSVILISGVYPHYQYIGVGV
jgi:hypothetical protein